MQNQYIFFRRIQIVAAALIVISVSLVIRLVAIQFQMDPEQLAFFEAQQSQYVRLVEYLPTRGQIYDRNGELFAVNTIEYQIGANPPLISDAVAAARDLAVVLGEDELSIYNNLTLDQPWVLLASPVSAAVGQAVQDLDIFGIDVLPRQEARRIYPQGILAAQVIGFVGGDGRGNFGVEGRYQRDLEGESLIGEQSEIPLEISEELTPRNGRDLVLTLDRDIQFLAESELLGAIDQYGAERGTIIIMNPRTGAVLAMASFPSYDPNAYYEVDATMLRNPAVSDQFEPGSIFKLITMSAALEENVVLPGSTYNDQASKQCGGITVSNWDDAAHGEVDMTQVLVQSLNVGTATIVEEMGPTRFYQVVRDFGFGDLTRIDLQGEATGTVRVPGDTGWQESTLCTNSFGQGLAVTPLQMLVAVNAIANDGLMMQPHIVHQIIDGDQVYTTQPSPMGRPISTQTARMVRDMMIQVIEQGSTEAQVPGYTVAGKTGTAQIPIPGGYEEGTSIASFVGFFPAEDPQVSVLIKLDRPDVIWGSLTAAPTFAHLAERLAVELEIPPDDVRVNIVAQGGDLDAVDR